MNSQRAGKKKRKENNEKNKAADDDDDDEKEHEDCEAGGEEENKEMETIRGEIKQLEKLLAKAECCRDRTYFKDIVFPDEMIFNEDEKEKHLIEQQLRRTMDIFTKNISPIADITCRVNDKQSYVFTFHNFYGNKRNNVTYSIHLDLSKDGWRVNKFFLPMFMDIEPIVKKFKLDNAQAIKDFLREIKILIETRKCREDQFFKLKDYLEELDFYDCSLQTTLDYVKMTLRLVRNLPQSYSPTRIILCSIIFEPAETRASKILVDCMGSTPLTHDVKSKIETLMNNFLEMDNLREAAKKIFQQDPEFWMKNQPLDVETENTRENTESKSRKRKSQETEITEGTTEEEKTVEEVDRRRWRAKSKSKSNKREIGESEEERLVEERIARVKLNEDKLAKEKLLKEKKSAANKSENKMKRKNKEERGNNKIIEFDKRGKWQLCSSTPLPGTLNLKRILPKDVSDINSDSG